jgi:hypothetical protein
VTIRDRLLRGGLHDKTCNGTALFPVSVRLSLLDSYGRLNPHQSRRAEQLVPSGFRNARERAVDSDVEVKKGQPGDFSFVGVRPSS